MMQFALRSNRSALGLLLILGFLLLLPVIVFWIGPPPRIEAYRSMSTATGTVGSVIQAIYQSPGNSDIVFLGSSLVVASVSQSQVQDALSRHLGRTANVQILAMNWPGLDIQYFMLRDYLNLHTARLIIWNPPEPHSRAYEYPHIQAYRWLRYGEYSDALTGLPFKFRLALYGEMVVGAPRQLLSLVRSNLTEDEATGIDPGLAKTGYLGAPFVPNDTLPGERASSVQLLPLHSQTISAVGPAPGPYQMHFARLILKLARDHSCKIVLLHVPLDAEFADMSVPELTEWEDQSGSGPMMIAAPSAQLFAGMDRREFLHFYRDAHFNENGTRYFTGAILPALLKAYDQSPITNDGNHAQ
jgi:hypothetical protein